MNKFDKIRDLHQFFLSKYKPKKTIILRFSRNMTYRGAYSYFNGKHYITLNSKDNYHTLCDSWVHEAGHSLQKYKYGKIDHSDHWGVCFAKAYRIYLEWDTQYRR